MISATIVLCDLLIIGTCNNQQKWKVSFTDLVEMENRVIDMTQKEFEVMSLLAIGGDSLDYVDTSVLYQIVGHLFEGWPNNLRPIP